MEDLFTLLGKRKSPFDNEKILVQSRGMERFLSLAAARHFGVAANLSFPFPSHLIHSLLSPYAVSENEKTFHFPYNIQNLRSVIYSILSESSRNHFPLISRYLKSESKNFSQIKTFQLSRIIADLYDRYAVQRPNLIRSWMTEDYEVSSEDEKWQRELYRRLMDEERIENPFAVVERYKGALRDGTRAVHPHRIFIFGVSAMPLLYREIFEAFSDISSLYFFNLSAHHSFRKSSEEYSFSGLKGFLCSGSWEYFRYLNTLNENKNVSSSVKFHSIPLKQKSLLNALQNALKGEAPEEYTMSGDDFSFSVHSCHTPLREVEALKNFLIYMFRMNDQIQSSDVIVMMKDVDLYAPFIHSVFGSDPEENVWEYSISDRHPSAEFSAWELFNQFAELSGGQFAAGEITSLSENQLIKKHFEFSDEDCRLFQEWIDAAKIRWGYNGKEKSKYSIPESDENTWRNGLDRILLGYLMPEDKKEIYKTLVPLSILNSQSFELFGNFLEFFETVHKYCDEFQKERTFGEWHDLISEFFRELGGLDDRDFQFLNCIRERRELNETYLIDAIRYEINFEFSSRRYAYEFLSGGITFCSLTPMRSVPGKVIAVLGLDENTFPASESFPSFDLISSNPLKSDLSRKNDDRQLFLELLLSAEESLFLSYTGKNVCSNKEIRPSSVISQTLNEIIRFSSDGEKVIPKIFYSHFLYSYHPDYFSPDSRMLMKNYSRTDFSKSESLLTQHKKDFIFLNQKFEKISVDLPERIDISDLKYFYRNPCGYFLKKMHIQSGDHSSSVQDAEIFYPDYLENYHIETELFDYFLNRRKDSRDFYACMKSSGILPHSGPGLAFLKLKETQLQHPLNEIYEKIHSAERISISEQIQCGTIKLQFHDSVLVYESSIMLYRSASIKALDMLSAWLQHLILHHSDIVSPVTNLFGIKKGKIEHVVFKPVANYHEILEELTENYRKGLKRPLPFFIKTSFSYAEEFLSSGESSTAIQKSLFAWEGSDFTGIAGERDDFYIHKCFQSKNLNEIIDFETTALSVLKPMIENSEWLEKEG